MRGLAVIVLVPLTLGLAGCRGEPAGGAGASLTIEEPADGDTVTGPVRLSLSAEGVEIGPPESGNMHFHVYVDGSDDYLVLPAMQGTVPVPNGEHTLRVVLAHPNHEETGTSDSVTITVSGGGQSPPPGGGYGGYGGGGGGDGNGDDTGGEGGYGY